MTSAWIERSLEALRRNAELAKKITAPTEAVEMGGDGKVVDLGEVVGRRVSVELRPGIEVKIGGNARIVMTGRGGIMAIGGGHGQSVSAYDARRILGLFGGQEVGRAVARDRKRRKSNFPKL